MVCKCIKYLLRRVNKMFRIVLQKYKNSMYFHMSHEMNGLDSYKSRIYFFDVVLYVLRLKY